MDGMFRQTPGGVRRGEDDKPVFAAGIETPVWKRDVGNRFFQEANKEGIRAENERVNDAERANRATSGRWKAGVGTLTRRDENGFDEEVDANDFLDDPEVGHLAEQALYKGDLFKAKQGASAARFKLSDPSDKRKLSDKEREDILAEGAGLDELSDRHKELKARLIAHDERLAEEKAAYEAEGGYRNLFSGGIGGWRQNRQKPEERVAEVQANHQQVRKSSELQDEALAGQEADIAAKEAELSKPTRLSNMPAVVAQREGLAQQKAQVAEQRQQVAAQREAATQQAAQQARAAADEMDTPKAAQAGPRPAAHESLGKALQDANLFGSATSALGQAADNGIRRKADGDWDLPFLKARSGGMLDGFFGIADTAMQKAGARADVGYGANNDEKSIQKVFHDFQQANNLSDEEVQAAWSDLGNLNRKWDDGEKARVLSDGRLLPNMQDSDWLDPEKAKALIEASAASPESKAATLQNLPQIQANIAAEKLAGYAAAAETVGLVSDANPTGAIGAKALEGFTPPDEWAKANNRQDLGTPQFVRDYEADVFGRAGWTKEKLWGLAGKFVTGNVKSANTILGLTGYLGSDAAAQMAGEGAEASALINQGMPSTGLIGAAVEEAPSIGLQVLVTRGLGMGAGALTGSAGAASTVANIGSFATAGAQSAGLTYADEIARGTSEEEARSKATKSGINTALITAAFGHGALGGVERVAAGEAAEMTVRELAELAGKQGVGSLVKSPELRKFAKGVILSAGGEAAEEGVDELLNAYINADPDTNLADAWSNAVEAAKVGGFIGGAVDVGAGAFEGNSPEIPTLTPDRVRAEMTAQNPDEDPATDEEISRATDVIGLKGEIVPEQAADIADGVRINRELDAAQAAAEDQIYEAEAAHEEALATGDKGLVAAAEANVLKAQAGARVSDRTRGALKIARGQSLDALTSAEARSLGIVRDGAMFRPMEAKELEAEGLKHPLVELGADGSPILLDEVINEVKQASPTGAGRIKLSETEARKAASVRAQAPATDQAVAPNSEEVGSKLGTKWQVTSRSGQSVEVKAPNEAEAQRIAAGQFQMGDSVANVEPVAVNEPAVDAQQPVLPVESEQQAPGNQSAPAMAAVKRIGKLKKNARLKSAIVVSTDPNERARATDDGKIILNVNRLVWEAKIAGLDDKQAEAWIADVIDEEVRHLAQNDAARSLWAEAGSPGTFEAWRESHYGDIWQSEFVANGKDVVVRVLYGESLDSLPDWKKAVEGLRMLSQQQEKGNPTEVVKLWVNLGEAALNHLRAVLKALKEMASNLTPALKSEISLLERELSKYEQTEKQGRAVGEHLEDDARPIPQADGDVRNSEAERVGKTASGGSPESSRRGEVLPVGEGIAVGSRVDFSRKGEPLGGVVDALGGGNARIRLDEPDSKGLRTALAKVSDLRSIAPKKAVEVAGDDLSGEWTAFAEDSGTLGIPRSEMPQIKAEDRSAMVQFLRARGVNYTEQEVLPGKLKPTQAEFSPAKVDKARQHEGGDRALLVSVEGRLIDGHHQWLAKWHDSPETPVRVIRLNATATRVLELLKEMPSVENGDGHSTRVKESEKPAEPKREAPAESNPRDQWASFQGEYKKLKGALTRAEKTGDPQKVLDEAQRGLERFESTGLYPDDWSRWERAKDDAEAKIQRQKSKLKLSEGEQKLKDAFGGLVDGLDASPLDNNAYKKGVPTDKIPAFLGAAQSLIAEGVKTPEGLAAALDKISDKLRPYSDAVWSAFRMVDPSLPSEVDWSGVYAQPGQVAEAATNAEESAKGLTEQQKEVTSKIVGLVFERLSYRQPFEKADAARLDTDRVLSAKQIDEAIEAGIAVAAKTAASKDATVRAKFDELIAIYQNQPKLSAKTSTSKINQAYSTPVPLAFVASRLADVTGGEAIFEPSAGHGMLLLEATRQQKVMANELDPERADRMEMQNPKWEVTRGNALENTPSTTPDRVVANPPFGRVTGEDGQNITFETSAGPLKEIDHAIMLRSLEHMADDGRAVFLIGGPPKTVTTDAAKRDYYSRGRLAAFYKHLHENYGVIDHFTVAGELYEKQGAGWPIDVIVIQGKQRSRIALPSSKPPRMLSAWDEVFQTTQLTDEQRIRTNQVTEGEVRETVRGMVDDLARIGRMGGPEASGQRTVSDRTEDGSGGATSDAISSEPSDSQSLADGSVGEVGLPSDGSVEPESAGRVGFEGAEPTGESSGVRESLGRRGDSVGAERTEVKEAGRFQAEYAPFSGAKGLDTLIPKNMVGPVRDAFDRITADLGEDLVGFVRGKLGYPADADITKYLAGEQIDAVAAAIWNFERGGALIVGDQTGIGKGRIAAALMKYAVHNGFTPIFMTQKPPLHDAMLVDDLADIEANEVIPAIMDTRLQFDSAKKRKLDFGKDYFEEVAKAKKLPGASNAVFVTYDQIQADDAKGLDKKARASARNAKEPPPHSWRLAALKALAPNSVIILDESHLASGQSTRGWRVADVIKRSPRVYYSSATSVKRPENMGIYFKTNVGALTGGNMETLSDLMNAGGVPAMQVVSSMLAKDGQYLRRERSFDGVKFATQIAEENADRDRELADGLTGSLRQIVTVQDAMRQAAAAINGVIAAAGKRMNVPASNRAKLETVNFSSKLHNIVGQYLLAIKTSSAAETAIREIRAGKKAVVAVQSTMESAIDGLESGGFAMTYKGLVLRYLDQMRFLQSGNKAFGRGEVETFEIKEKGEEEFDGVSSNDLQMRIVQRSTDPKTGDDVIVINEKVAAELMRRAMWDVFVRARETIEATEIGDLPISPIDAMRQAVERAGIRTGEITGRSRGIDENGEIYVRPASEVGQQAQVNAKTGFNDENLDFLVINQSGSTGISLHASEKAKNKAQRVMIVAQPNLDINEFMQTLGRIHRSGQVVKPEFILLQTALPAEKRPAAILGRKMAMLNANTTSNAKTDVSEGNTAVDIFNQYGDEVAYRVLERDPDLQNQLRPLGSSLSKFFTEDGRLLSFQDAQKEVDEQPDGYIARTITGYLAILPVEEQELFWERTISDYQAYIAYLDQIGQNALEAKALDLKAKTIAKEVFTPQREGDSAFSDPSYIETVETKIGRTPLTGEEAVKLSREGKAKSRQLVQDYLKTAETAANEAADRKAKRSLKWDDQRREEFLAGLRAQRNTIANAISMLGRFGNVGRDDGHPGLGVIEEIRIDASAPLTPSKQVAVIRVNDSRETMRVPLTQLAEAFTPSPEEDADEWNKTTDIGGERMIATGNLMAAMQALSGTGKVVTYTTEDGGNEMGILLPKTFAAKHAANKARVGVDTAEKLVARLDSGKTVDNGDGTLKLTPRRMLIVPASQAQGGKYWRNPKLNALVKNGYFIQVGNEMRAEIPESNLSDVFNLLQGMGETFGAAQGDSLSAAPLPKITASSPEWKAMTPDQRREYLKSSKGLDAAPLVPKEKSQAERISGLYDKARPKMASKEAEAEVKSQQDAFRGQGKVVGRPDLANLSGDEEVREFVDTIDELRKTTAEKETRAQWENDGAKLAANPDEVAEKWLTAAYTREGQEMKPEDVVAARLVIERKAKEAGNDLRKHEEAAMLVNGYRQVRSMQARVLAAGVDPFKRPAERHREFIASAIYTLPPKILANIEDRALPPSAARALVQKALRERLETIEKALRKMGVTLDEIMGGQVFLSLSQSKVLKDVLDQHSQQERMAVAMIQKGNPIDRIRKATGLPDARIRQLFEKVKQELRERLRDKVKAGLRLEDLRDQIKRGLSAASLNAATLTDEQVEAELDRIIGTGFGLTDDFLKPKKAIKPKKAKIKTQPREADWTRPEFEEGLRNYDFDTKGRSDIMYQVAALRDAVGASGTVNKLTGAKKAKAEAILQKIESVLATKGTSISEVFASGKPVADYRFDISDMGHVMVMARTIQALDADWIDKGQEYVYASMLSGIQTNAVNLLGGIANTTWQATVERGFETLTNLFFQNPDNAQLGESKYMIRAMGPMISRAWSNAVATWGSEISFFEEDIMNRPPDLEKMAEGVTGYRTTSIGGTKGRVIRTPLRLLLAADTFVNTLRACAEVGAMAYRVAKARGLKPGTPEFETAIKEEVNVPGSLSWQRAAQKAFEGTFNNALPGQRDASKKEVKVKTPLDAIGHGIQWVSAGLNPKATDDTAWKLSKALFKMLFFPFVRVPFNILKQGIERSINPVSALEMAALLGQNVRIRNGKFTMNDKGDKARIIENLAKQLQGTMLMALFSGMAEGDDDDLKKTVLITGSRPYTETRKGERELGYRMGLGPYEISLLLPGGKRLGFSYARIEPAATVLGGTVDTLKNLRAAENGRMDGWTAAGRIGNSFIAQANEKTVLRGMADLRALWNDEKPVSKFAADRLSVIMPNLVKQAVRESDPVFRESPEDFATSFLRGVWPYGQTPAKVDLYGEVQKKDGTAAQRIVDFTDAGVTPPARDSDRMIYNWIRQNPTRTDVSIPATVSDRYTDPVTKKPGTMTAGQHAKYAEVAGQRASGLLRQAGLNINNPSESDMKRLKSIIDDSREFARKMLLRNPTWKKL